MGFALKLFGVGLFVSFIYFAVDTIQVWIMSNGLPILPSTLRYFGVQSGLFVALNIFIKIVIYCFIVKQVIGYLRSL